MPFPVVGRQPRHGFEGNLVDSQVARFALQLQEAPRGSQRGGAVAAGCDDIQQTLTRRSEVAILQVKQGYVQANVFTQMAEPASPNGALERLRGP